MRSGEVGLEGVVMDGVLFLTRFVKTTTGCGTKWGFVVVVGGGDLITTRLFETGIDIVCDREVVVLLWLWFLISKQGLKEVRADSVAVEVVEVVVQVGVEVEMVAEVFWFKELEVILLVFCFLRFNALAKN